MSGPARVLDGAEVARVVGAMQRLGLTVCVDRGFALDALVPGLARPHQDLDVLVAPGELPAAVAALAAAGYRADAAQPAASRRCVDDAGRCVDVGEDAAVLAPGFVVQGRLADASVPCVSAPQQMARRARGRIRDKDLAVIQTLHQRLGVALPRDLAPLALLRLRLGLRRFVKRCMGRR